ncbi:MAG: ParB/RepB/Spo0J family partition protein [Anaerolineae bacterium]
MPPKRVANTGELFDQTSRIAAVLGGKQKGTQRQVPLEQIAANPYNPRSITEDESLEELVESIRQNGFLGALDGREMEDGTVQVAYGARRLAAARAAGMRTIPVIVREWDDERFRFVALVENLVREDLPLADQAASLASLNRDLGLSLRDIAGKLGKPLSWVEDCLALERAPEDVRALVAARPQALRAARFIARIADPVARQQLEQAVRLDLLTTQDVHRVVTALEDGAPLAAALAAVSPAHAAVVPPPAADGQQQAAGAATSGTARGVAGARLLSRVARSLYRFNAEDLTKEELSQCAEAIDTIMSELAELQRTVRARLEP